MSETNNGHTRQGVLLANLGTPDAPDRKSVARFLREFLSDPRVVDLPRYLWIPLLYGVIIPLRAGRSAAAYRKIWSPEGSPLLVLTQSLADRFSTLISDAVSVEIGMRYGQPSIHDALQKLRDAGVEQLNVIPLYPQFSHTTTTSIYDSVNEGLLSLGWQPKQNRIEHYYQQAEWVTAVAESIREFRQVHGEAERLIFSLHGIPQRYVANGDPYQAHCESSVGAITSELAMNKDDWLLTYQSRVGREPWLQPYTDLTLKDLAESGVKHVQVVCPGFAVDCLETLEEIAMQNNEIFQEAGGEKLEYIPALNDSEAHARALMALV